LGEHSAAQEAIQRAVNLAGTDIFRARHQHLFLSMIQLLAINGDTTAAREKLAAWQERLGGQLGVGAMSRQLEGTVAYLAGDWPTAIANLRQGLTEQFAAYSICLLAHAYLQNGEPQHAVEQLETKLRSYDPHYQRELCFYQANMLFLLGRAYLQAGNPRKARTCFERFLHQWTDADPGLEMVEQARTTLGRLNSP
jgi:tetratricopeptide (TPR) repeat protein